MIARRFKLSLTLISKSAYYFKALSCVTKSSNKASNTENLSNQLEQFMQGIEDLSIELRNSNRNQEHLLWELSDISSKTEQANEYLGTSAADTSLY